MQYEKMTNKEVEYLMHHAIIEGETVKSVEFELYGRRLLITSDYNGIRVSKPKADKIENQWLVYGEIEGAEIKPKHYKYKEDADQFIKDLTVNHDLKIKTCQWNVTRQELITDLIVEHTPAVETNTPENPFDSVPF